MNERTLNYAVIGLLCGAATALGGCFTPGEDPADTDNATESSGPTSTGTTGATLTSTTTPPEDEDDDGTSSSSTSVDTENPTTETTGTDMTAEVRVVHASPDAGAVDVYAAGSSEPLLENVEYTDASAWLSVAVGELTVELRPAGASADSEPVYTSDTLTLAEGDRVSTIAAGLLGAKDKDTSFRLLSVAEAWGNEIADRARVRVIHAGADAPPIEVGNLERGPIALERYADADAAGVPVDVAGGERIDILAGGNVVTSFTTPAIAENDEVLVVATGLLGSLAREDDGFGLIAVGQGGKLAFIRQDPELFTLHGARDADALELCADGMPLAANIDYSEIQSVRVAPGNYDASLYDYPAGCTGAVLNVGGNATGELEAGERYLFLITGERNPEMVDGRAPEPGIQLLPLIDRFTLGDEMAGKYRFVHGASAEEIFVGSALDGEIVAQNVYTNAIGWRFEAEDETSILEGFISLGVADASPDPTPEPPLTPIAEFPFDTFAGDRAWGIISGDPSPDTVDPNDAIVQLMVVDTTIPGWGVTLIDVD